MRILAPTPGLAAARRPARTSISRANARTTALVVNPSQPRDKHHADDLKCARAPTAPQLLDAVRMKRDVPGSGLKKGMIAAVVDLCGHPAAFVGLEAGDPPFTAEVSVDDVEVMRGHDDAKLPRETT